LKKWLVEYKFQDWKVHRTSPAKKGHPVTKEEKDARAEEIARLLADNQVWHSHGRRIGIATLTHLLKLEIDDFSSDVDLTKIIRDYSDFALEHIIRERYNFFFHSKKLIVGG